MHCEVDDIKRLVEEVEAKASRKISSGNSPYIHSKIKEALNEGLPFGEDYLYKRIIHELRKAEKKRGTTVSLNYRNLDPLARYIGFDNYIGFTEKKDKPADERLVNFTGTWYSYVRCNSQQPFVLMSPVEIRAERNNVYMLLKGPNRMFRGRIEILGSCLHCLLESGSNKKLHLVMQTGLIAMPDVLQGVFSGMSAGGEPIAGRELLVREPGGIFEKMKNSRTAIDDLRQSGDDTLRAISHYFNGHEGNTLKAGRSATFTWRDLLQQGL
jgi:hypothetical protein